MFYISSCIFFQGEKETEGGCEVLICCLSFSLSITFSMVSSKKPSISDCY